MYTYIRKKRIMERFANRKKKNRKLSNDWFVTFNNYSLSLSDTQMRSYQLDIIVQICNRNRFSLPLIIPRLKTKLTIVKLITIVMYVTIITVIIITEQS